MSTFQRRHDNFFLNEKSLTTDNGFSFVLCDVGSRHSAQFYYQIGDRHIIKPNSSSVRAVMVPHRHSKSCLTHCILSFPAVLLFPSCSLWLAIHRHRDDTCLQTIQKLRNDTCLQTVRKLASPLQAPPYMGSDLHDLRDASESGRERMLRAEQREQQRVR